MTTKREIERAGYERGQAVASWVDLPEIGEPIDWSVDWWGLGETVTRENVADYYEMLCDAAEKNGRQFSPFEMTANELNKLQEVKPYDVWQVYEDGIQRGFRAEWRARKHYYEEE